MPRVLLVEDDASLGRTLTERLERERLEVVWARTVAEAQAQLQGQSWDLAILDVKLPDGSGFGLARELKRTSLTPVMFMTALNSAENRLEGFEIGADEYLPKPFHLKEFILRVRHVLATQRVPEVVQAQGRTDRPGRVVGGGPGWSTIVPSGSRRARAEDSDHRRAGCRRTR